MTTLTDTVRIQDPGQIAGQAGVSIGPLMGHRFRALRALVRGRTPHPAVGPTGDEVPQPAPLGGDDMTSLMDTVRTEAPARAPLKPVVPVAEARDATTESRSLERSFEVESARRILSAVVGRLAYFDDEAQTYMVLTRDGVLVRVPLRDITSSHGVPRRGLPSAAQDHRTKEAR